MKGVSLHVGAGETVAIVGPSGSGKSTIGRLLFRFYDVLDGALKIDGQDIRDITQTSLHAQIGVVPQDTVLVDMGEMFGLLDQPSEVQDKKNASDLKVNGGEVHLDDVVFGYEPERPILKGVSLHVGAGETVAIVGPSGSGKSTIGRLLFRFYDVLDGALKIDGQDIRDITQTSLHAQIGVVPQDTVLFNDTIFYNIAYGRPEASRAEIEEAARAAKIHDFISALPDGYQTTVGERGLKLSGGEKQRVGIARTLLKNPPILLPDEATSALDTETEAEIQHELRDMSHGRTVITIAHRLSTIADADRIVVLEKGVIAEQGSHDELLDRNGRYAAMWHRQAAEEEAA